MRSASSESKSPTSRANASSSGGSVLRFTSCSTTRTGLVLPRCASSGKSSGQRTARSSVSDGAISMISSSMPGIACPPPSTIVYSRPSGIAPFSSAVARSTVTMSPGSGRSSTGDHAARWSRSCSICSSTAASVTSGARRVTVNPSTRASSTSGRTSTCRSNVMASPSLNLRSWTWGWAATLICSLSSTCWKASWTTRSMTSWRMASLYFFLTISGGALPGRKPGRRTLEA